MSEEAYRCDGARKLQAYIVLTHGWNGLSQSSQPLSRNPPSRRQVMPAENRLTAQSALLGLGSRMKYDLGVP
jgi:hypothetical protein